ncbi:DUF7662 domain-containing protein [Bradyrhizobium liaoningense]
MSKYEPLYKYLCSRSLQRLVLTFAEIEEIIGDQLPASAIRPQWWENVTDPNTSHVQCRAWRAAGYSAFLVHASSKVRFEKSR